MNFIALIVGHRSDYIYCIHMVYFTPIRVVEPKPHRHVYFFFGEHKHSFKLGYSDQ